MRKFIEQQQTTVPEVRRNQSDRPIVKFKKRRGRKKSFFTVNQFFRHIWALKQFVMNVSKFTRETFRIALFADKRTLNSMNSAFVYGSHEADEHQRELQKRYHRKFCRPAKLVSIPVFNSNDIINRNFEIKKCPPKKRQASVTIARMPGYNDRMHYFAMIMPDNCMVADGICRYDRVVAVANVRPAHGDMVVCVMPGSKKVTVRRYAATCNPGYFDLYEGGTINPLFSCDHENLIYGVVVAVVRNYWPGRLPR